MESSRLSAAASMRWWLLYGLLALIVRAGAFAAVDQGAPPPVSNAQMTRQADHFQLKRDSRDRPMHTVFANCFLIGVTRDKDQWWVLPASETNPEIASNQGLWVLPVEANADTPSWYFELGNHRAVARLRDHQAEIDIDADSITISSAESRPHSDVFGHRFTVTAGNGHDLENALAGFYWGTVLPLVVERTVAAHYPYSDGYVLSTLMTSQYAGTYPAVDHEFQIAGRLAMGSPLDLDVVRRMIELQYRVMDDDPEGLSRDPCSVQPNGKREYHIRRNSKDNRVNAAMFPVTGNIEVISETWHYYEMTRNIDWLRVHIANLEHAAGWTLAHIDQYGRLWSDVYYEDQVMKDGRETEAQAFAARSFELLSRMESLLGRKQEAHRYQAIAKKMMEALVQPLPTGYWDAANRRFIDWVDRNSKAHDHIPLVANTAPVTLGYTSTAQAEAVKRLIQANDAELERFPSFVAAHVEDYSDSEMGVAGPYDLSAAGRYWYWDAAYRTQQKENATLLQQLLTVAAEGAKNNYFMGERYDMDHVYYINGENAHGARQYFEYPNVFLAVLITDFLGIQKPADADVSITPHLSSFGAAEFTTPAYAVGYTYTKDGFTLTNLAKTKRSFEVNLSALEDGKLRSAGLITADKGGTYRLWLAPHETAHWTAGAVVEARTVPAADHHAHLQSATAARLLNEKSSPPPGSPREDETQLTATDLIAQLDAAGVRRAAALSDAYRLGSPFVRMEGEAATVDAENDWTLRQVQRYPRRLTGFCSVNPTRPYARAAIEHCARIGLRGGLKLHLANAGFRFDDPSQVHKLREIFAEADRLRLPILIHLRPDDKWDAENSVHLFMDQVLPAAPNIPVQVAHLGGWGGYDRTTDAALSAFAGVCAAHPGRCRQLYFDTAAVVLNPSDANAAPGSDSRSLWDAQKDFPEGPDHLAGNLRSIGLSHMLFGTDWPYETASDSIQLLRTYLRLTPVETDQIFRNLAPYFR